MPNNCRKSLSKFAREAATNKKSKNGGKNTKSAIGKKKTTNSAAASVAAATNTRNPSAIGGFHPFSRKATQLNRCVERESRVRRSRHDNDAARDAVIEKYVFFRSFIVCDLFSQNQVDANDKMETPAGGTENKFLSRDQALDAVQRYIDRHQYQIKELEALIAENTKLKRNVDSEKRKLENLLVLRNQRQSQFARGGIEIPDLTSRKNVALLRDWNGDPNSLSQIPTIVLKQAQ